MYITSINTSKMIWLVIFYTALMQGMVKAETYRDDKIVPDEYINSCAVCHGIDGKGDGPMHNQLTKQPKDLTVLSRENGGLFPETVVYQLIDGRRINLSHGSREMPVWGQRFRMMDGNEEGVEMRITNIIEYLESIQN